MCLLPVLDEPQLALALPCCRSERVGCVSPGGDSQVDRRHSAAQGPARSPVVSWCSRRHPKGGTAPGQQREAAWPQHDRARRPGGADQHPAIPASHHEPINYRGQQWLRRAACNTMLSPRRAFICMHSMHRALHAIRSYLNNSKSIASQLRSPNSGVSNNLHLSVILSARVAIRIWSEFVSQLHSFAVPTLHTPHRECTCGTDRTKRFPVGSWNVAQTHSSKSSAAVEGSLLSLAPKPRFVLAVAPNALTGAAMPVPLATRPSPSCRDTGTVRDRPKCRHSK